MAVLQPQKVIHDSSHLWPMRSENKVLRILSLGHANSQPTVRRSALTLLSWLLTIRKLASQKPASGKLHSLVQIVGDVDESHRGWELCTNSAYSARSSVGLDHVREMATSGRLGFWLVRGQPIEAIHNDEFNLALLRLQIQTELLP